MVMLLKDNPMPTLLKVACALIFGLIDIPYAAAADCGGELQGQGQVLDIVDARTLRLTDGREIRLIGIISSFGVAEARENLIALVANREIELRGDNDTPDRYGRQHAFVSVAGTETPVQIELLRVGAAQMTGTGVDAKCGAELSAAETLARQTGQGIWADPGAIKDAAKPADILAMLGQFAVIEGRVLSARQSGATFYLNFGRHWARDFAVIIPRPMIGLLTRDGIDIRALAGHRVRIRGWVEQRGGPRVQLRGTRQIEVLDRR